MFSLSMRLRGSAWILAWDTCAQFCDEIGDAGVFLAGAAVERFLDQTINATLFLVPGAVAFRDFGRRHQFCRVDGCEVKRCHGLIIRLPVKMQTDVAAESDSAGRPSSAAMRRTALGDDGAQPCPTNVRFRDTSPGTFQLTVHSGFCVPLSRLLHFKKYSYNETRSETRFIHHPLFL